MELGIKRKEMKNQLERLIEDIDEFDRLLKSKGYDGFFLTNAGYPDRFKNSIMNHFYGIISGKERNLEEGLWLSTYLRWTRESDGSSVLLDMKVDYVRLEKFQIKEICIKSEDMLGQKVREETIKDILQNNIPSIEEAIGKVTDKLKRQRKMKIT